MLKAFSLNFAGISCLLKRIHQSNCSIPRKKKIENLEIVLFSLKKNSLKFIGPEVRGNATKGFALERPHGSRASTGCKTTDFMVASP